MTAPGVPGVRTCPVKGLMLVPANAASRLSDPETARPAISAPKREAGSDPLAWNGWDTFGSTLYLADAAEGAFAECIAVHKAPRIRGEDREEQES